MSIFRKINSLSNKPDSPSLLFRDLRRDPNVKFLWAHQGKMLEEYHTSHINSPNIALELPTGTGKTLVGLLIGEYQRKTHSKRVVYVCPTRQLCHQVLKQARQYGIECSLLIGQQQHYDSTQFSRYQRAMSIAITTYSGIFNSNPRIDDPEIVICDDAHAADSYIADLWTLKISRIKYEGIFQSLVDFLGEAIPSNIRRYIQNIVEEPKKYAVDLIPFHLYANKIEELSDLLNTYLSDSELKYSWGKIHGHIEACNIFVSPNEFLIRPLIPPTKTHKPFVDAEQRIFMSATLGEGGDLERITGIPNIKRLPVPPGWNKLGSGRRLILFTNLLTTADGPGELVDWMIKKNTRSLILVADDKSVEKVISAYKTQVATFKATDIEDSLANFTEAPVPAILVLANRYDGIDLPGDDCRETIFFGSPSATNLQEKFFYQRLGAISQLRDRIRTRITQGLGRCTRDENDYAVVLLAGDDILKWFSTKTNTDGLHPEIQAEVQFGFEQGESRTVDDLKEICEVFLAQTTEWIDANQRIIELRDSAVKQKDNVSVTLEQSVSHEINYIYAMWNHDFERAYQSGTKATETLNGDDLKPYRAFWHYAASIAGYKRYETTKDNLWRGNYLDHLNRIQGITTGVTWLPGLKDLVTTRTSGEESVLLPNPIIVSKLLEEWHLVGSRFEKKLKIARECINSDEANKFEIGLNTLGRMLGFYTNSWSGATAAPDGFWEISDELGLVFEAKSDELAGHPISVRTVRQAGFHENWLRGKGEIADVQKVKPVLIAQRESIGETAHKMANNLFYVKVEHIRELFKRVATVLNEIRLTARNISEERLHELILERYNEEKITADNLLTEFFSKDLKSLPIVND